MISPCGNISGFVLQTDGRFGEEPANALFFLYGSQPAFNPLAAYGLLPVKMRGTLLKGDQLTSERKGVPR